MDHLDPRPIGNHLDRRPCASLTACVTQVLAPTIHVVFAKLSCFCVDYFNKMAELVFATVFDTHMCRKKLKERQTY